MPITSWLHPDNVNEILKAGWVDLITWYEVIYLREFKPHT